MSLSMTTGHLPIVMRPAITLKTFSELLASPSHIDCSNNNEQFMSFRGQGSFMLPACGQSKEVQCTVLLTSALRKS